MGKSWDRPALERDQCWKASRGGGTLGHLPGLGSRMTTNREDREFQEWTTAWAEQVLRVLRPGGWLVAFGATRTFGRVQCGLADAGFESRDTIAWLFGSGFPKSVPLAPGVGSALKPAMELIAVCRAPFKGSARACHEAHGTGGLNIDEARVPLQEGEGPFERPAHSDKAVYKSAWTGKPTRGSQAGRWPANVCHDGSEEVLAGFPESKSARVGVSHAPRAEGVTDFAMLPGVGFGDGGTVARFYYCAKASTAEREAGCEGLEVVAPRAIQGRRRGSVGSRNPRAGVRSGARANIHPTVKPISLMRWLVRLVVPAGGVVLDPFTGERDDRRGGDGRGAALHRD